jgi:hypothetical protein
MVATMDQRLKRCRRTCELVHVFGPAARRKRPVGQLIDVVPHPVVGIEKCCYVLPRAVDRVRMSEREVHNLH